MTNRKSTTGFETLRQLTPEGRLRNVAESVIKVATPSRRHTGRGRMPSYSADKHTIAFRALHLAELIIQYLDDGELEVIKADEEIPF